jgi:hypothetical protein
MADALDVLRSVPDFNEESRAGVRVDALRLRSGETVGLVIVEFNGPLFGDFSDPEIDPADEMPSLDQQEVSAPGDLWEMGEHRLLCGNSLRASNIHKLMGDELARMVIADAPYNLKIKDVQGLGQIKHREFAQASGEMSPVAQ